MELAIQIVVLITALVGLYKAATFDTGGSGKDKRTSDHPLGAFLEMAGVFGMILIIPLVMLAFMWITTASIGLVSKKPVREPVPITAAASDAAYLLNAATSLRSYDAQDLGIKEALEMALRTRDFGVALAAADSLRDSGEREAALKRIVEKISNKPFKSE